MSLENLEDLFLEELKDIFDAEKRLLKALPKMAKAADDDVLTAAFTKHAKETQKQVDRLEKVFKHLKKTARGKTCIAMQGLITEGEELMGEEANAAVMDAGLICAAQKVEHYEIAAYGTLVAWAKRLGNDAVVALLEITLREEEATDETLTQIAESINFEAEEADEE
jgi:ferritin-like metal-binding protein YciE